MNIQNGGEVNFIQLLKYFANKIALVSLNTLHDIHQIHSSDIDHEKDFDEILLKSIKEILKITEALNNFIKTDKQIQELHEEIRNNMESLFTSRVNGMNKLIQNINERLNNM